MEPQADHRKSTGGRSSDHRIGELLHYLSGMQIIAIFVRMRVWPLQARAHPMWEYEGPSDSTRISPVELSANELASHVRLITCTKSLDEININSTVKPYSLENPIPEVRSYFLFLPCHFT